jgi:SAM-dependent methyltransferase
MDAVLVANTYHELTEPEAVLLHVWRALRPGGRLVVVDPAPGSGSMESADTEAHHYEPPDHAEERLRRTGFAITSRQDRFIDRPGGGWWLIVAKKPEIRT